MTNLIFHNNGTNTTTLVPQKVNDNVELTLPAKSGKLISLNDDEPKYVIGYRKSVYLANEKEKVLSLTVGPGGRFPNIQKAINFLDTLSPNNYYNNALIEIMDGYEHHANTVISKSEFRITIRPHDRTHLSNNTSLEVVMSDEWINSFVDNGTVTMFNIITPCYINIYNIHFKVNNNLLLSKKLNFGFITNSYATLLGLHYCVIDGFSGNVISNGINNIRNTTFKNITTTDISKKKLFIINGVNTFCYACTFENIDQFCLVHIDFDYYFSLENCTFKNCKFTYIFINHFSTMCEITGTHKIENLRYNALSINPKNTHPTANGYVRDSSTNDFPSSMP